MLKKELLLGLREDKRIFLSAFIDSKNQELRELSKTSGEIRAQINLFYSILITFIGIMLTSNVQGVFETNFEIVILIILVSIVSIFIFLINLTFKVPDSFNAKLVLSIEQDIRKQTNDTVFDYTTKYLSKLDFLINKSNKHYEKYFMMRDYFMITSVVLILFTIICYFTNIEIINLKI